MTSGLLIRAKSRVRGRTRDPQDYNCPEFPVRAHFPSSNLHTKMRSKGALCVTIILGVFYQVFLNNFLFVFLNIGGVLQPLEDFGYDCQRIYHPLLESCEDLWLDQASRILFAACGDMNSRQNWVPAYVIRQ